MKQETRYAYQQKIKNLEDKINVLESDLYVYRMSAQEIFDGICDVISENKSINIGWVLKRLRKCLK